MNKFKEQYKNPLWQKKRLEIFERDNFQCTECFSKDKTLNVHHRYYLKNKNVWEYPNESLITMCSDCHEDEYSIKEYFNNIENETLESYVLSNFLNISEIKEALSIYKCCKNTKQARILKNTLFSLFERFMSKDNDINNLINILDSLCR